jgi:hypothetical protein
MFGFTNNECNVGNKEILHGTAELSPALEQDIINLKLIP